MRRGFVKANTFGMFAIMPARPGPGRRPPGRGPLAWDDLDDFEWPEASSRAAEACLPNAPPPRPLPACKGGAYAYEAPKLLDEKCRTSYSADAPYTNCM
jgi:hypothetical protein